MVIQEKKSCIIILKFLFLLIIALLIKDSDSLSTHEGIIVKRMTTGLAVQITEFPSAVSIKYLGDHTCGGVILSENVILTASHCVENTIKSVLQILIGGNTVYGQGTNMKTYNVSNYKLYLNYDLALIKLKESIKFDYKTSKPVTFSNEILRNNLELEIVGWGNYDVLHKNNKGSDVLRRGNFVHLDIESCVQQFSSRDPYITFKETNFCALNKNFVNACQGDSGGGVYHKGELIGIVHAGTCDKERNQVTVCVNINKREIKFVIMKFILESNIKYDKQ